ncbi:hypothetical protein JNK13_03100 [bacterium]|nr:hypothetical protein [bacterium]
MSNALPETVRESTYCSTLSKLDFFSLQNLLHGQISALRVPSYYPISRCAELSQWFIEHKFRALYGQNVADPSDPGKVKYLDYHVDRIGYPRNLLIGKSNTSAEFEQYFSQNNSIFQEINKITKNNHPIVKLIEEVSCIHRFGACIEKINGQQAFCGIGRITRSGKDTLLSKLPHVDGTWPYTMHFSANIYLQVPELGGELELLGGPILSAEEVAQIGPEHEFRADPNYCASQLIKPEVGDLIIINTRQPHAVRGFENGKRVSISSFIGYDPGQALKFYS